MLSQPIIFRKLRTKRITSDSWKNRSRINRSATGMLTREKRLEKVRGDKERHALWI